MKNKDVRTRQTAQNNPRRVVAGVDVLVKDHECLIDVLPISILIFSPDGVISQASRSAESLFGYNQSELIGKSLFALIADSEAKRLAQSLGSHVSKGHGHVLLHGQAISGQRRDGRSFPAELTISEAQQACTLGFVGVFQDMTQIFEARNALNHNQERFALAMAGTNEGLWDWDVGSGKVYYSNRVGELFGLDEDFGPPDAWFNCVHPDDRERYQRSLIQHLKGETPFFSIDYRLNGPGNRWVRHRGLGLRDGQGHVFRMAGSVGDITEAKLAETKLQESLAQAESASKAKSDFMASMSHELRTPLNAVIGFSEMIHGQLLGPVGQPKYIEYANDIMSSARHLLDIITDILEMARLEAGHAEFHPEPLDMGAVIDATLRLLHQRVSHSGLSITAKMAPNLPPVLGDERRLKQVMINLVGNAIKFTPKGGQIIVEAKPVLSGHLMVRVIDSGIGIAERDIPRAMAPFTQVDSVVARRYQGSGLGLPLAKAFVELHGGNLELSSLLGKGTTVTFHLPLHFPD